MQKTTERKSASNSHSHGGLHSGVLSKKVKRDARALARDARESAPILSELWDQSAPKIAKFYRSYWRPIALATTGIAVAAFGAYYMTVSRKPMKRFLRMARS